MEGKSTELTGRSKLVFEACLKMQQGEKLYEEGRLELENILGHKLKSVSKTPGQKSAETKRKAGTFRLDKRSDDDLAEKMIDLVRKNTQASTILFKKKLHISDRRVERLLVRLVKARRLEDKWGATKGGHHAWVIPKTTTSNGANGHAIKINSSPASGRNINGFKTTGRGSFVNVTDPELVNKTVEFLKTHDWVNKGKLVEEIELSRVVVNRLLDYMQKQKLVKQVFKTENPAHKDVGKIYKQELPYWELA